MASIGSLLSHVASFLTGAAAGRSSRRLPSDSKFALAYLSTLQVLIDLNAKARLMTDLPALTFSKEVLHKLRGKDLGADLTPIWFTFLAIKGIWGHDIREIAKEHASWSRDKLRRHLLDWFTKHGLPECEEEGLGDLLLDGIDGLKEAAEAELEAITGRYTAAKEELPSLIASLDSKPQERLNARLAEASAERSREILDALAHAVRASRSLGSDPRDILETLAKESDEDFAIEIDMYRSK